MFSKVVLLSLNLFILGFSLEEISENEFGVISTSQSPQEEINNRRLEAILELGETNKNLLAVLTHMTEAEKLARKNENRIEGIKEQFEKKLQQLEKRIEELQQTISEREQNQENRNETFQQGLARLERNLELNNQTLAQIQQEVEQQETIINEQQTNLSSIEGRLEEKNQRIAEMQVTLDKQEKMIEIQQYNLSEIEQNLKEKYQELWGKIVESERILNDLKKSNHKQLPKNCKEVKMNGNRLSEIYLIQPKSEPFNVWCDMDTDGGGWTVFQNRFDGSVDFYRNWTDYKLGFGSLYGEFWLGLQHLHELTETGSNELAMYLVDRNKTGAYASYDDFKVDTEEESYSINTLGDYRGTAGNSFHWHTKKKFSTLDRDEASSSCPSRYKSGWWFFQKNEYSYCLYTNLNGKYSLDGTVESYAQGINWYKFSTDDYSLLKSKMMVR